MENPRKTIHQYISRSLSSLWAQLSSLWNCITTRSLRFPASYFCFLSPQWGVSLHWVSCLFFNFNLDVLSKIHYSFCVRCFLLGVTVMHYPRYVWKLTSYILSIVKFSNYFTLTENEDCCIFQSPNIQRVLKTATTMYGRQPAYWVSSCHSYLVLNTFF